MQNVVQVIEEKNEKAPLWWNVKQGRKNDYEEYLGIKITIQISGFKWNFFVEDFNTVAYPMFYDDKEFNKFVKFGKLWNQLLYLF